MDLSLLDVTDIPGVDFGDEVMLLGQSDGCSITALDIAQDARAPSPMKSCA